MGRGSLEGYATGRRITGSQGRRRDFCEVFVQSLKARAGR